MKFKEKLMRAKECVWRCI